MTVSAVRKLVASALATHGYCVVAAASPSEALEHMKEPSLRVDLLLTDVVLPEMSGRLWPIGCAMQDESTASFTCPATKMTSSLIRAS